MTTTVAAIIPVYNRPRAVVQALDTVVAQTKRPTCVVVVDDGSTDDTADEVRAWMAAHKDQVDGRLVQQDNAGASAARNRAVREAADCDYLAFLDSDDLWPDDFLERMVGVLETRQEAVAANAGRRNLNERSGKVKQSLHTSLGELTAARLFAYGPPGMSNTVIRREAFEAVGGFDTNELCGEDYQLFLRLMLRGRWLQVPGAPVIYRRNTPDAEASTGQLSSAFEDRRYRLACILEKYINEGGRDLIPETVWKRRLGRIWYSAGRRLHQLGRPALAYQCYSRSAGLRPWHLRAQLAHALRYPSLASEKCLQAKVFRSSMLGDQLEAVDVCRHVADAMTSDVEGATLLKDQPSGRVVAWRRGDVDWVVKYYSLPWLKRVAYQHVKRTPAWREWRGAASLAAAGLSVVSPLALVDHPVPDVTWTQALVMPRVQGMSLDRWLRAGEHDSEARSEVFRAVGRQIGLMTRNNMVNRDHKSANLMIDPEHLSEQPTIIDLAGVRQRTPKRVRRMFDLLAKTTLRYKVVTEDELAECLSAARGVDPSLPA